MRFYTCTFITWEVKWILSNIRTYLFDSSVHAPALNFWNLEKNSIKPSSYYFVTANYGSVNTEAFQYSRPVNVLLRFSYLNKILTNHLHTILSTPTDLWFYPVVLCCMRCRKIRFCTCVVIWGSTAIRDGRVISTVKWPTVFWLSNRLESMQIFPTWC